MDGISQLLGVPGIDDDAAVQALCGTGELGKDHHTVALFLAGDVLVRDEVHAVPRRGDEAHVRDSIEGRQLVRGDRLVHEVDGHKLDSAELAVDAANQLVDDGAKVLVLLDILTTGDGDLDENDLAYPLGVFCEEDFEGVQLLRDTLDVVQTVDTDNELDALELALEGSDALLHLGLLQAVLELVGVDTDRECAHGNHLALELHTVWRGSQSAVRLLAIASLRNSRDTYRILEQLLRKWRA